MYVHTCINVHVHRKPYVHVAILVGLKQEDTGTRAKPLTDEQQQKQRKIRITMASLLLHTCTYLVVVRLDDVTDTGDVVGGFVSGRQYVLAHDAASTVQYRCAQLCIHVLCNHVHVYYTCVRTVA